jgi:hypothetical protein
MERFIDNYGPGDFLLLSWRKAALERRRSERGALFYGNQLETLTLSFLANSAAKKNVRFSARHGRVNNPPCVIHKDGYSKSPTVVLRVMRVAAMLPTMCATWFPNVSYASSVNLPV